MPTQPLGRRAPSDWKHVEKYPFTAVSELAGKPTPVVIGVNWYVEFDEPERDKDGSWWVARDGKLSRVRGGHCVCLKPQGARDSERRRLFYNQGNEGACVGFGVSRMASILNGKLYDARWLYHEAQKIDEWPGENYDGTSVRAGLDILRTRGHRVCNGGKIYSPSLAEGISANRWIRSIPDCLATLGYSDRNYVEFLNSWGQAYPRITRMPVSVLARLWAEDGEIAVVTDR